MSDPKERKYGFLLGYIICMALAMIFAFSWQTATLDGDSYMYAAVAKDIAEGGGWLNIYDPGYGGAFYFHFPLAIWITALLFKILGEQKKKLEEARIKYGDYVVPTLFLREKF